MGGISSFTATVLRCPLVGLPVLHGMSRPSLKRLGMIQTQTLRNCLGLPKRESSAATMAENIIFSVDFLRTRKTALPKLCHVTPHLNAKVANSTVTPPRSRFGAVIGVLHFVQPLNCEAAHLPLPLSWLYEYQTRWGYYFIPRAQLSSNTTHRQCYNKWHFKMYSSIVGRGNIYTHRRIMWCSSALVLE